MTSGSKQLSVKFTSITIVADAIVHCVYHITYCATERTKNFSGAEIEGLVKSAASFALNRQVDVNDLSKKVDEENIKVHVICLSFC